MLVYVTKRLFQAIPVLFGVSLLTFIMMILVPGDPAQKLLGQRASPEAVQELRTRLGLNDPPVQQYLRIMSNIVRGDLGRSVITRERVIDEMRNRFPVTLKLALLAMAFSTTTGVLVGMVAALYQNRLPDRVLMFITLTGISVPVFWYALIAILLVVFKLRWLPQTGIGDGSLTYYWLPAFVLGTRASAFIARITRSAMLEVIRQDYVRTARAKGLSERTVTFKHAARNIAVPVVTVVGLDLASFIDGAFLTEYVFNIPGLGRYGLTSLLNRDLPVMIPLVIYTATLYIAANLLVDILYGVIDPRIRYD
ncbi:MAG: ABC transporter permease [Truepera sp.]|nr:ABC transporter permease [Truepera sp.]HRN18391.1 ABC transporter permease [Trueperaceae bacterium]HRQ11510.1 ABC transporter permease [Trueperaceae bacterium]